MNKRWTAGPSRVALVDLGMRGGRHGPFNAMLLRVVAAALPGVPTEFWSDATHGEAVRALNPTLANRVAFEPANLWDRHTGRDELVTVDRLWHDVRTLRSIVLARSGPTLLIVSSLSATGLFAAAAVQRLFGPMRVRVQFVMHGNLASLKHGWRPRNPVHRALGLGPALRYAPGPALRVLVLEETVAEALGREMPQASCHVDVLPHPANEDEAPGGRVLAPVPQVAMVGLATRAKGADVFIRMAARLQQDIPGRIGLSIIGRLHPDLAAAGTVALAVPPEAAEIDRAVFVERIRAQDYVCLPYAGSYYELAASGSLLDAISCGRPIIAVKGTLLQSLFDRFGDIGFLCADEAEMLAALRRLATAPDPDRYAAQVAAITRLRTSRLPAQLAPAYRSHLAALEAL